MEKEKSKDPCWKGYEKAGTKEKDGRTVPNCIPSQNTKTKRNKSSSKK